MIANISAKQQNIVKWKMALQSVISFACAYWISIWWTLVYKWRKKYDQSFHQPDRRLLHWAL